MGSIIIVGEGEFAIATLTGGTIRAEYIPLRCKDTGIDLDIDGGVSCYGIYTFRIVNPELFYKAAIRSMEDRYRSELLKQMDSEVLTALAPAISKLAKDGIRPSELLQHTTALCDELRLLMSDKWSGLRGIEVVLVALESVRMLDAEMIL